MSLFVCLYLYLCLCVRVCAVVPVLVFVWAAAAVFAVVVVRAGVTLATEAWRFLAELRLVVGEDVGVAWGGGEGRQRDAR